MPLPPAPTKRAALLSSSAFDAPAKSSTSTSTRTRRKASEEPTRSEPAERQVLQQIETNKPARPEATKVAVATTSQPALRIVPDKRIEPQALPDATQSTGDKATTATRARRRKATGTPKMFVLDTNVLLHDPMCLFRFEEHDIFLPMIVLEELDGHKKGMTEVARNARQTSRWLDALAGTAGTDIVDGLRLDSTGHRDAGGKLFFQTEALHYTLPTSLPQGKADNQILGVVDALGRQYRESKKAVGSSAREVVLVSKDINMRVKARALGLATDDYQNDKTLADGDLLYAGSLALPTDFWSTHGQTVESWQQGVHTFYRISGPVVPSLLINQFVFFEAPGEPSLYARVTEIRGKTAVFKTLKDFNHLKNAVWGITTRNREQNFAMNLLMDPEVDFVTLTGTAGTGKTLMALAAGLTQVLDDRRYTEIIMTRATVSVGEDIGFLPGTEEEKMGPWMGALDDNLEVLGKTDTSAGEWGRAATSELIRSRIKVKSMNFMRGRTFLNKY